MGRGAQERQGLKRIVCDTGPILHLWESAALHLLPLAGSVHIPAVVENELSSFRSSWPRDLPDWIVVTPLAVDSFEEASRWSRAGLLDPGEAHALALAQQIRADWLLTDDAAARMVAGQLGLEVHGSLGVVLWAAASGHLTFRDAEKALEALAFSSLWVSSRVLSEARTVLRQMFDG